MKFGRWALLAILIGIVAVAQPAAISGRMMQQAGKEEGGKKQASVPVITIGLEQDRPKEN